jgi:hypothetical protein
MTRNRRDQLKRIRFEAMYASLFAESLEYSDIHLAALAKRRDAYLAGLK